MAAGLVRPSGLLLSLLFSEQELGWDKTKRNDFEEYLKNGQQYWYKIDSLVVFNVHLKSTCLILIFNLKAKSIMPCISQPGQDRLFNMGF